MGNVEYRDQTGKLINPPNARGRLEIPIEVFPKDIVEKMLRSRSAPSLTVLVEGLRLYEGVDIKSNMDGTTIEFEFETYGLVQIKEDTDA